MPVVVFEGLDRCGKSRMINELVKNYKLWTNPGTNLAHFLVVKCPDTEQRPPARFDPEEQMRWFLTEQRYSLPWKNLSFAGANYDLSRFWIFVDRMWLSPLVYQLLAQTDNKEKVLSQLDLTCTVMESILPVNLYINVKTKKEIWIDRIKKEKGQKSLKWLQKLRNCKDLDVGGIYDEMTGNYNEVFNRLNFSYDVEGDIEYTPERIVDLGRQISTELDIGVSQGQNMKIFFKQRGRD